MRPTERRGFPWLVAVGLVLFGLAVTYGYTVILEGRGILVPATLTWSIAFIAASFTGAAGFYVASVPQARARMAAQLEEQLIEKELHLQELLASAPVLMFRTDKDGIIQLSEGAASAEMEDPEGGWVGKNIFDFGSEDEDWVRFARKALAGEVVEGTIHQGGKVWAIKYQPWMENGRPNGMLGVATDVTVRMQQEQEEFDERVQEEEMARLRQLNEMKTNLLNTAAHELNTPMTPIRLQLHLLGSSSLGKLTEKQERALSILNRAVDRLGLLVDDILDVARVQSGRLKVELQPTRMHTLLEEIVDTFQEPAQQVGVQLELQRGDDLWAEADAGRITQVLTNLVSNAIKFTPEGGTIKVRCRDESGRVRVEIEDSGRGLTSEEIDRLFQPFSQVHDAREVTARGTGLGLYISRGILDHHGGEIGVTSAGLNKGSTFHFDLQHAEAQEEEVPAPPVEVRLEIAPPQPAELPKSALAKRLRELI